MHGRERVILGSSLKKCDFQKFTDFFAPESKNHIFIDWSVFASFISITQNRMLTLLNHFVRTLPSVLK